MSDYSNSSDMNATGSGTHLLSLESPDLASTKYYDTRSGVEDLSLSELWISDQTAIMQKPFSLLAEPEPTTPNRSMQTLDNQDHIDDTNDIPAKGHISAQKSLEDTSRRKEEKLQSDIFILKKLNASFELFNETLHSTGSANQRIAAQLEQTNALLDKYVNILAKSEEFSRIIFDERWLGADDDEEVYERDRLEERKRILQQQQAEALRIEQENIRFEREKEEKMQREAKERLEREKSSRAIRGGIRGARGTRASIRGVRPPTLARSETPHTGGTSQGIPRRPPSGLSRPSTNLTTRGIPRPI